MQKRVAQQQSRRRQHNGGNQRQHDAAAHAAARCLLIPRALRQAEQRRAAIPDHQRSGQRHHREGIDDVGRRVAQIPHAPADENLIDNVIKCADEHRQHARYSKMHEQLADRRGSQCVFLFHKIFLSSSFVQKSALSFLLRKDSALSGWTYVFVRTKNQRAAAQLDLHPSKTTR